MLYRSLYRHLLSRLDAERIHNVTLSGLAMCNAAPLRGLLALPFSPRVKFPVIEALGLKLAHPLGLAAGFDKNGRAVGALGALGFSFIEVGTVTPRPQAGNPMPRLFRLPADAALINRMGFPSAGMVAVEQQLRTRLTLPIGISLGKNKDTPLTEAQHDYNDVLARLYPHGDFFVVNISSPNTPDLRKLQTREYLSALLGSLSEQVQQLAGGTMPKPLLVKIAPDLTFDEIDDVIELALLHGVRGLIATNTTSDRTGLNSPRRDETGGLSGQPLRERSTALVRHIYRQTHGSLMIIGAGGIFSAEDAWDKITAGASLLQAYTGFIYEGPTFARTLVHGLHERWLAAGSPTWSELIGSEVA
jgi:dihydroorotate dehydrogenase